jgi:predicted nucleic acid-binding protein
VNQNHYYFDANALFKFYRSEDGSMDIRRIVSNPSNQIYISSLTIVEFIGAICKWVRKGYIRRGSARKIVKRLRKDIGSVTGGRPFRMIKIPEGVFRLAERILLERAVESAIGSCDALHLAMASRISSVSALFILVTSDIPMQGCC